MSETKIMKRLDRSTKIQCAGCRKSIQWRDRYVQGQHDGLKYHLFCAVDEVKVQVCTTCFMIGRCECDD